MLVVDSAAPVAIPVAKRLRFADAGVPVAFNVLDEQIDSLQNLFVLELPARVLIPCARRESEVHGPLLFLLSGFNQLMALSFAAFD